MENCLCIANPTHYHVDFAYRLPENERLYKVPIKAGAQIELKLRDPMHIRAVIDQHARFGFTEIHEALRGKAFCGLLYSIDKPIPVKQIQSMMQYNDNALLKKGQTMREQAAVAVAESLDAAAARSGDRVESVDIEIREQGRSPAEREEDLNHQTIRVRGRRAKRAMSETPTH